MTWLVGSTDVAHFRQDLYDLLTGQIAAGKRGAGQNGNAAQVAGADAWERLDATNFILRSKTAEKPWRLPIAMYRGKPRLFQLNAALAIDTPWLGKPTYSGAYSGATARVYIQVSVTTQNTSPGDLTGTVLTYAIYNADTNAAVKANTTVSGWSGASDTKLLQDGVSVTLTLGVDDQFPATARFLYVRGYSSTYPQGIDYIPEAGCFNSTDTPIVSNTSNGSNNYTKATDYKLVGQGDLYPAPLTLGTAFGGSNWGGQGVFYGVEWQNAASPPAVGAAYYIVDCNCYPGIAGIGYDNQVLFFQPCLSWDPTAQRGRFFATSTSLTVPSWTKTAPTTPYMTLFSVANPTGTTFINFWISVKSDKIVMVLRGDPANAGYLNAWTFQRYTPLSAWDAWPWITAHCAPASTTFYAQQLVAGRMIYDNDDPGPIGVAATPSNFTFYTNAGNHTLNTVVTNWPDANPSSEDDKWWLAYMYPTSQYGGKNPEGNYTAVNRPTGIRGKLRGVFSLANDGFTNLDELTDGVDTYLLTVNQNLFGLYTGNNALAVLEE